MPKYFGGRTPVKIPTKPTPKWNSNPTNRTRLIPETSTKTTYVAPATTNRGITGGGLNTTPVKVVLPKAGVSAALSGVSLNQNATPSYTAKGTSTGGSGGNSYAYSAGNIQSDLADYYKDQNDKARDATINAIWQRFNTQKGLYESQYDDLDAQYDALINQNEVNYYKNRIAQRENQANRGQLDSGYGRQENLTATIARNNGNNAINLQRQRSKEAIANEIRKLESEREADIATTRNEYANAIARVLQK